MHTRIGYPSQRNRTRTVTAVGGSVPEVTMTVEEYLELVREREGSGNRRRARVKVLQERNKRRRTGKKDPKMARALRKANKIGRTKAGKLRKGYTQAKIMKKAHQLRRKM